MAKLKYRLLTIGLCVVASLFWLFPRHVVERVRNAEGNFTYDTVRAVPLKRGLDLQGGMYILLGIDESKGTVDNKADAIDRALKVVRNRMDQFGVSEPIIQKAGTDRIIVELPGLNDPDRARSLVQQQAHLQFQITDETQALERVAGRLDAVLKERGITAAKPGDTASTAGSKSLFTKADTGKKDSTAKKDSVGNGPFSTKVHAVEMPGKYAIDAKDFPLFDRAFNDSAIKAVIPPGKVIRWSADTAGSPIRYFYVLDERAIIDGQYLEKASPQQDPQRGTVVNFQFNNEGGRRFRDQTSKHVHDFMAIVLDNTVVTAPTINEAIGARGEIQLGRGRSISEAQDLALVLRAGSLPAPLKIEQLKTIGPSLGQDSIDAGMHAGIAAVVLVVLIMLVYYRFSGLLAVAALMFYILFTLAILAGFDATLTMPGLAGFVLSIGIAVDANILIFERIREELVGGKTVRLAIDEGFRHAMSAIIDSNVSTALTAAVLYNFGTGPVKGFAVTLLAGIAASLFTAIFVVRTFYMIYLSRAGETQTLSI
ncbi:MAG TPA: protein translocase subunit SecD [Gemmatimonadaceae bacterium]|nr:protein translocase subunit SecD [Gemmatimonadaceae bacterium]